MSNDKGNLYDAIKSIQMRPVDEYETICERMTYEEGHSDALRDAAKLALEYDDGRKFTDQRKRYMLFAYDNFYPRGANEDCIGMFDTDDERDELIAADEKDNRCTYDYYVVLDMDTGEWTSLNE